jgi:hypothetical protein
MHVSEADVSDKRLKPNNLKQQMGKMHSRLTLSLNIL